MTAIWRKAHLQNKWIVKYSPSLIRLNVTPFNLTKINILPLFLYKIRQRANFMFFNFFVQHIRHPFSRKLCSYHQWDCMHEMCLCMLVRSWFVHFWKTCLKTSACKFNPEFFNYWERNNLLTGGNFEIHETMHGIAQNKHKASISLCISTTNLIVLLKRCFNPFLTFCFLGVPTDWKHLSAKKKFKNQIYQLFSLLLLQEKYIFFSIFNNLFIFVISLFAFKMN